MWRVGRWLDRPVNLFASTSTHIPETIWATSLILIVTPIICHTTSYSILVASWNLYIKQPWQNWGSNLYTSRASLPWNSRVYGRLQSIGDPEGKSAIYYCIDGLSTENACVYNTANRILLLASQPEIKSCPSATSGVFFILPSLIPYFSVDREADRDFKVTEDIPHCVGEKKRPNSWRKG